MATNTPSTPAPAPSSGPTPEQLQKDNADLQAKVAELEAAAAEAAASDDKERIATLEAENAALTAAVEKAAVRLAEPDLPDGYVYVVDAAGQPIPSNPFVPKDWLDEERKHLLPEGAKKATKEQEAVVKAAFATLRGPR